VFTYLGPDQDRGIQTIRGQVSLFIRQKSVVESIFRWVVIDDVDTFPHISQQALRRPMESIFAYYTIFIYWYIRRGPNSSSKIRCIHIAMNTVDIVLNKNDF
jgi:DNA polymerase III delta prime subunit